MPQRKASLVRGSIFLFAPYFSSGVELGECPVGVGLRGRVLVVGAQLGIADLDDITQRALRQIAGLHPVGKVPRDGELRGRVHARVHRDWRRGGFVVVDPDPPEDLVLDGPQGNLLGRGGCPGQRPHQGQRTDQRRACSHGCPLRAARRWMQPVWGSVRAVRGKVNERASAVVGQFASEALTSAHSKACRLGPNQVERSENW